MGQIFLLLTLMSMGMQTLKAAPTIEIFTTNLASSGDGLLDLERRIREIDSSFVSITSDIQVDRISHQYSFVMSDSNGRSMVAVLAIIDPKHPEKLKDVIFLLDPFHDKSNVLGHPDYLKYQILEKLFAAPGMANIIKASSLNFSVPRSDFFTLSFLNQYFKLKGMQEFYIAEGISSESLRTLELGRYGRKLYKSGNPSFDVVQTGVIDLIDTVVAQDIRIRDVVPTRLHYELAVELADNIIFSKVACATLF